MSPETRRRIAQETLEIYAPIAQPARHGEGQGRARGPRVLLPLSAAVRGAPGAGRRRRMKVGSARSSEIRERLDVERSREAGIEAEISDRVKRYYSICQKLRRQGIDIARALRLPRLPRRHRRDLRDCYAALGIVHQLWRPIPGRFKDYIAMPKPNLYQSLHTTVIGRGRPAVRGPDPDPRDGPDRRGGDRGALELQGGAAGPRRRRRRRPLAAAAARLADATSRTRASSCRSLKVDLYPGRGLRLHAQGRRLLVPARRHAARLRLPRSTPTSATTASARGSTAGSCRCARRSRTATSSRS